MLGSIAELLRVPPGLGFRGTWTGSLLAFLQECLCAGLAEDCA